MFPCTLGSYSPGGQSTCTVCPAGNSCTSVDTTPCPAYQTSEQGQGWCSYYIAEVSSVSITGTVVAYTTCDPGQYKLFSNLICLDCPLGHYCPVINGNPVKCLPGTYQDTTKQIVCKACPTTDGSGNSYAYYSVFGEYKCHKCPAGHFCPNSTSVPQQCQLGFYSVPGSTSCTQCSDGYICRFKEQVPNPTYSICPRGFYCKSNPANNFILVQMPCPAGTYQPLEQQTSSAACIICPAGYYCQAGSEMPRPCTPGSYCLQGTISNQFYTCPDSNCLVASNGVAANSCPGGTYSMTYQASDNTVCIDCPDGFYCPSGANYPVKCPTGYYCSNKQASGKSQICPIGTYSGPFSILDVSQCQTCPVGFYCPSASTLPIPCPTGTYNPSLGKGASTDCTSCPVNRPCPYYGQSTWSNGLYCAHGYYCPLGTSFPTQYPCPAGTYSDNINITSASSCTTCPAKFACYKGSNTLTNQKVPCAPGYYCPAGTPDPQTNPCPAGTYSPFTDNYDANQCFVCPAGQYCNQGSATPTGYCIAGYYCPQGSSVKNQQACPAGTYQPNTGAKSLGECQVCPLGYYCGAAVSTYTGTPCPAGTYGPVTSLTVAQNSSIAWGCFACIPGYYCPNTAMTNPLPCGIGYYSSSSEVQCSICPSDHYCANLTTSITEKEASKCDNGYLCTAGTSVRPFIPDYACPKGQYCQKSMLSDCPAGTYQPKLGASDVSYCLQTPAGYYTSNINTVDYRTYLCPEGYYCPAGSTDPKANQCPEGTYRNIKGGTQASDCGLCPTGYYCPQETVSIFVCPLGYYCPQGSTYASPCPIGTFGASVGLREQADCTVCYPGRYCSQDGLSQPDGLCDAGYYCISGAFTATPTDGVTGDVCKAGGFCAQGSKKPASCQQGTVNPDTGATDVSSCKPCPAGQYCSGSNNPTPTGDCYPGYYCTGSSSFPNQNVAPKGTYTLSKASVATNCAKGTYNPYPAQWTCLVCPEGYLCDVTGIYDIYSKECPTGSYCPQGSYAAIACPVGTFNSITRGASIDDCQTCTSGKYCSSTGLPSPSGNCLAGYFCKSGSSSATPTLTLVSGVALSGPCPQGYYCPANTGAPAPCPSGTYGASTMLQSSTQCTTCPAGKYCSTGGLSTPEGACAPGYYCPAGSITSKPPATHCVAGQKCPSGASSVTTCPAGTYQKDAYKPDCIICPKGYGCPAGTTDYGANPCLPGYYCPEGSLTASQVACKIGTYNARTIASAPEDCIYCDSGKYCANSVAQIATNGDCPQGYYCLLGAWASQITPSVVIATVTGYSGPCQPGFYCPTGSPFQIPCPAGSFCSSSNLAAYSPCPAGKFCGVQTITNYTICPAGSYCPEGSSSPLPCPAGTFNAFTGKSQLTDCLSCTATKTCSLSNLTIPNQVCPAGYYCDGGQITGYEKPCSPGFKCPSGSSAMIPCSGTGEYQDLWRQSTCNACPAGYECTDSSISRCEPQYDAVFSYYCLGNPKTRKYCPQGTFNNMDRSSSADDCFDCPPGYYCPSPTDPAQTTYQSKIIICPAGYYCLRGAKAGIICPQGFYCPVGTNTPIPCTAGRYCSSTGLVLQDGDGACKAGYYCSYEKVQPSVIDSLNSKSACADYDSMTSKCVRGSITDSQIICPEGYYCPQESDVPIPCPIGTYSNQAGLVSIDQCTACDLTKSCSHLALTAPSGGCSAGYFCDGSDNTNSPIENECQKGYYCPANVNQQIPCPKGFYQPQKRQASCLQCPNGFICESQALLYPVVCPQGYYCNSDSATKNPCPSGTYSNLEGLSLQSQCQRCESGNYCTGLAQTAPTGLCNAGYYCNIDVASSPILIANPPEYVCPKGSYCPSGTIVPITCPPGTYNELEEQSDVSACTSCPIGYICETYGMGDTNDLIPCPLGYYCQVGSRDNSSLGEHTIFICPAGSYCDGTRSKTPIKCKAGSFNPMEGQYQCIPCPKGQLCDTEGLTFPNSCPIGSYCPLGTLVVESGSSGTVNKILCPAGTFNQYQNLSSSSQCQVCPMGQYCVEGETKSTGTGPCNAGFLCDYGAVNAQDATKVCPTGHYCPEGATYPSPCSAGTYNPFTGSGSISNCLPCPYGQYTGQQGQASCKPCADGFVCLKGSTTSQPTDGTMGRLCNPGSYCLAGVEAQCVNYNYQNLYGQKACFTCPDGYSCLGANSNGIGAVDPVICVSGYFCTSGRQTLCPEGRYGNGSAVSLSGLETYQQCAPCPTGYYCTKGVYKVEQRCLPGYFCLSGASAENQTSNLCPAGFYCDSYPTLIPIKCPNGTFSLAGAASLGDCTACLAGYYCMDGSSEMRDCPAGSYCPVGTGSPIPCPKGTYTGYTNSKSDSDCRGCPSGSLCNITGIADPANYLCPPGYYCLRGTLSATACQAGTYRGIKGGSSASSCYVCPAGYYCNSDAQVVPMLCSNGTFCPTGSVSPLGCPPGYYCPAAAGSPIKCPGGFYCPGRSELYYKCANGTYCPPGTASPITCPGGTFGSGYSNNANVSISCDTCGRGMYSTSDNIGLCLDCTAGYVCLGSTNSAKPTSVSLNKGYICPSGYYCPTGSYEESACPKGTYNPYQGMSSQNRDCLKCPASYYSDVLAASGCKSCGTSSTSLTGATTCTCIGKNRRFIKSTGACLCELGYKASDNKTDSDSVSDCEAKSKQTCLDGQDVDVEGNCITPSADACKSQCGSGSGTLVEGTGVCQCTSLVDPEQVCNSTCRSTEIQVSMSSDGNYVLYDPLTKNTTTVDPTTLPGYIGDYKCTEANSSNCKVVSLNAASSSNGFTFDYKTDTSVLKASGLLKSTTRRMLQSSTTTTTTNITNPVMCIKQGNAVLFKVSSASKSYPVYYKDSILNTNKDFDYGPFLELQSTIEKSGGTVNAFSYVFKDAGIYVFSQANDATQFTVIGVVSTDQSCSNADAYVQPATAASLASIGIVSQPKVLNPQWSFIIGVFVFMVAVVFGIVALIMVMHNNNSAQNVKSSAKGNQRKNNIYYDLIEDIENKERSRSRWCSLCNRFRNLSAQAKIVPTVQDLEVSYKDLELLLGEFKDSMDVLKEKLKEDSEKDREPMDENAPEQDEEDLLLEELAELRKFVFDNKECIENFFGIQRDDQGRRTGEQEEKEEVDEFNHSRMDDFDHAEGANFHEHDSVHNLLREQQEQEEQAVQKVVEVMQHSKDQLLNQIRDKNDEEARRLIDEFRGKLNGQSGLSAAEKDELLKELEYRLSSVENILKSEESSQDKKLQDALARRRKKKEELASVMMKLSEAKNMDNEVFAQNMQEIAQQEQQDRQKLEQELEAERQRALKDIESQMKKNRSEKLADMEKRLEHMRKKKDGEVAARNGGLELGDMLNEYGKLVKKVEEELEAQKEKELSELESKLAKRKEERLKTIQKNRKDREEDFHQELNLKNKDLNTNIEQIKSLLKPVLNEDSRIQALLDSQPEILRPILKPGDDDESLMRENRQVQATLGPLEKQLEILAEEEDKKISKLQEDLRRQADRLAKDQEQQRKVLMDKIASCKDEKERKKLMEQFEKLEKQLQEIQRSETEEQNDKLRDALKQRKARKDKVAQQMKEKQQQLILDQVNQRNQQIVDANSAQPKDAQGSDMLFAFGSGIADSEEYVKRLSEKLSQKFDKDELVQVSENFMEQKHLRELQEYMLALFEERARGLRKYIFQLMTQKQTEMELITEEFAPQYEFLKDKRAKGQISEQQYKEMLQRLRDEENEKRIDVEIQIKELEQKMEEEFMTQGVKSKSEAEQSFKDRQAEEKLKMIDCLMAQNKDSEAVRQYLEKEKKSTVKELAEFKKQKEKEKVAKLKDMERKKREREQELIDKQDKLLNWEERIKQEEAKHLEAFEKQKNAIIAKKMKEQNAELLRDLNKDQIDDLKQQHARDMANLETALEKEQKRQSENMRAQMGQKFKGQEMEKVQREIKMTQLIKDKEKRTQEMLNQSTTQSNLNSARNVAQSSNLSSVRNSEEQVKLLTEKARLMQKPLDKKKYCGATYAGMPARIKVREFELKKAELQRRLLRVDEKGQAIAMLKEKYKSQLTQGNDQQAAQLHNIDMQSLLLRAQSTYSEDSLQQEEAVGAFAGSMLTFKDLIDHVERIETNYQHIKRRLKE